MTRTVTFVIPAMLCWQRQKDPITGTLKKAKQLPRVPKLVGYYTNGKQPNFDRAREYADWKAHVLKFVPVELRGAGANTREHCVRVDVVCYFPAGTHSDVENVRKGVVDTLFPNGDRWVYGYHHFPLYDAAHPRVEVAVTLPGRLL